MDTVKFDDWELDLFSIVYNAFHKATMRGIELKPFFCCEEPYSPLNLINNLAVHEKAPRGHYCTVRTGCCQLVALDCYRFGSKDYDDLFDGYEIHERFYFLNKEGDAPDHRFVSILYKRIGAPNWTVFNPYPIKD